MSETKTTVIDIHGHVSAPKELYVYRSLLLASRGEHGKGGLKLADEVVAAAAREHIQMLKNVATDIQLISPRPFQAMHSEKPHKLVHWLAKATNDVIAQNCRLFPDIFRGVAGLPQCYGVNPTNTFEELERCVKDLGFVGCILNPDPGEGAGEPTPNLGHEYWYPLYEKLVELDIPALIHAASCRCVEKESYSHHMITEHSIACWALATSDVFTHFPKLKIVVSHGGGSVPYQIGRWRAGRLLHPLTAGVQHHEKKTESFDESLRKMYFDGVIYSREALEYLVKTVGTDRVLFGTEVPGVGSAIDPHTGRRFDDLKPLIDEMSWLSATQRTAIFEKNARSVFTRI
jgi:predicted TIM-barrel fold metal-dependent hydrolase